MVSLRSISTVTFRCRKARFFSIINAFLKKNVEKRLLNKMSIWQIKKQMSPLINAFTEKNG
jgi:hypothetical protein